jgi:hypothetical protein
MIMYDNIILYMIISYFFRFNCFNYPLSSRKFFQLTFVDGGAVCLATKFFDFVVTIK